MNSQKEAERVRGVSTDATMVSADTSVGDTDGVSCPVCDKTFKNIIIHLKSQAQKDARHALEMEKYNVCAYCPKMLDDFSSRSSFNRHVQACREKSVAQTN